MALLSRLARISLLWKFALVNLIPILLLGLVLQHYLHSRVSERAIDDATKQALSISRSEVERFLSEHDLKLRAHEARDARDRRDAQPAREPGARPGDHRLEPLPEGRLLAEAGRDQPPGAAVERRPARAERAGRRPPFRQQPGRLRPALARVAPAAGRGRRDLGRLLADRGRRPRPDEELLAPHPPRARCALRRPLPDRRRRVEGAPAAGGGQRAPGAPRLAHGPAQPHALPRPRPSGAHLGAPRPRARGRDDHGPRPLQGGQRHARPCERRRAAEAGRPPALGEPP